MKLYRTDLFLVGVIAGLLLFYLYVMPTLKEKMASLTENTNIVKMDQNTCSRSCCKHSQWPVPHLTNDDTEHIGTNLMCNNGDGGGCVCVTEDDLRYVSSRGENGE
ncbi:hypothetical protein crov335 [Cafeteria roenbergensis virus]|uniref:Uncharacterized protein n=1 Tax=Cafeteria roenbergensis virus (strain BV-PW1) TaxID=693272 RepID=E3T5A6_CROVB|nr:hypothetical protein crov335 [Cafeteria roenbergensis virus BV-PW1]ADO67369.1 hypothetical protein crov335 [Cafeteria roenbergensis virus BV-PW1]